MECTDPEFLLGGGVGVQAQWREHSLENFIVILCFLSPQLILQFTEGVKWFYNRENYFS